MKLEKVNLLPAFTFACIKCGFVAMSHLVNELWADLDGEPFKAYYCESCKQTLEKTE